LSAQGDKFRNRPEEDLTTRRTAEDEIMRGDRPDRDRGVGKTGGGTSGGSGTGGRGMENEGTGSLLVDSDEERDARQDDGSDDGDDEGRGSGSTKGGSAPGVSGKRGMSSPTEKEGEGHSGPISSGSGSKTNQGKRPATEQDRASAGEPDDNAREGYEDHGSSHDADGTQGESSGSRPGYR
jgi:hypothetical protein